jgi:hypothetical protein
MRYSQASRCGTPSLSTVLTLKSDSGHRRQTRVCTEQSNLKSPQITCYCIFFIQLYSAITVLATCPRTQGYRKDFSTLNVGLARTGNQTQATCLAGSVARRSAIHSHPYCRPGADYVTPDKKINVFSIFPLHQTKKLGLHAAI